MRRRLIPEAQGHFGGDGSVLYHDYGRGDMTLCICQTVL